MAPERATMTVLPAQRTDVNRARWIAAALFGLTVLLFSRVLAPGYEFVNYDDPDYVTENAHIQTGLTPAGIAWALKARVSSNWHPLTLLSHMLDWTLYGANPRGHHATSVLLHGLNAALAFLALRRLTGSLWTSAFFAALFAWHPLRVESVAWVAERKDVLSGLCWFVTLWAYAIYVERRRDGAAHAGRCYALALVAFALGLMAKPMLVTLPCVLLLLDFWPLRRIGPGQPPTSAGRPEVWPYLWLLDKLPFFALSVASSFATLDVQKAGGSVSEALDLTARLANAVISVVRYVWKFLVPFDLAVLYPHPGHWPARQIGAALVVVTLLTVLAVWQYRRRPWVTVGWLWFLGTLVPVIGIVQVGLQAMADRYTYLPILGVQLAGLWTLRERIVSPAARRTWTIVGAVVLAACAVRTWDQLGVWKNSFTLFDHAIAVTKDNYLAYKNRGIYLDKVGRTEEAALDYRRALAIRSDYQNANNNLGRILVRQGHAAEAVPLLRQAVAAQPTQLEVRNNLANALSDTGAVAEAMEHYDYILAREPRHVDALTNSGVAFAMQGKLTEARARIEAALRVQPDNLNAHSNLGNVCAMLGQRDEAIRHYRRAIELDPRDGRTYHNLGNVLAEAGQLAEAAESYARAVAATPTNAESRALLGFTYARLGRRDDALRELRAALLLQPNYAQAKSWLQAIEQSK